MIAPAGTSRPTRGRPTAESFRRMDPFGYVGSPHNVGAAVQGIGYDAVAPGRTRRALGLAAGLMASADRHLSSLTLGRLRQLCYAHDRQSSLFSGMLDTACDNIVGERFEFVPDTGDETQDQMLSDYLSRRMEKEQCDAKGLRHFAEILEDTIRTIWTGGDVLHVKRTDGSLLTFEPDQIETPRQVDTKGKPIVLGVETDAVGRHTAYWVKQYMDRLGSGRRGAGRPANTHKRVAAANCFFPAFRKRFSQTRGVPFCAAILGFCSRFTNYIDFEALAAEINSMMGIKIKREPTEADITDNAPAGTTDNQANDGSESTFDQLQRMETGMVFQLLPGEDVEMFGANRPGANFEPYIVTCCRIIGVGVGMPLEWFLKDFSRTSFASGRLGGLAWKRAFVGWQKWLEAHFARGWARWQIARGIATGELPANEKFYNFTCQWPPWEYTDPEKEMKGNVMAMGTMVKGPMEVIRERGMDPRRVIDDIAKFTKMAADKGLEYIIPQVGIKVNVVDDKHGADEDDDCDNDKASK